MCRWRKRQPPVLTHPEEPPDPAQTLLAISIPAIFGAWMERYAVPVQYREDWEASIIIQVYDAWPQSMVDGGLNPATPGATWSDGTVRHLACLAPWFNPGVIAHEQAHNSYSFLHQSLKDTWPAALQSVMKNRLVQLVYSLHPYAASSPVEGHAELYRYLGDKVPEKLKLYYPKLY